MPGRQEQARRGVDERAGVTLAIYHASRDVEPHLASLRRSAQFRLTCVSQRSARRFPAGSVDGVLWELKAGIQPDRRRLRRVARGVVAASYSVDDDRTLSELSRAIGFASHLRAPLRAGDVSRVFAARSQPDLATRVRAVQPKLRRVFARAGVFAVLVHASNATLEPPKVAETIVARVAGWFPSPAWAIVIEDQQTIFGGKAAPGYFMAKLMIKLINSIAQRVNADPITEGRLRVAFVPDFTVKTGQKLYPAADLSEQISTAGQEASGTGNMKFAMNGALTIGTMDGANIEIREQVGPENFFLFGLTAAEVKLLKANGYRPRDSYEANAELKEVLSQIRCGFFSPSQPNLFEPLVNALLYHDTYMLLADFEDYVNCQEKVGKAFLETEKWTRTSILNVARIGHFSSDRSIRDYCERIWKVKPAPIELPEESLEEAAAGA